MKGHRSRGRAARVVVAGHGRCVRLSGSEKRRRRHDDGVTHEGPRRLARLITKRPMAPSIQRTAKENQAARSRRAVVKMTPLGLLGRAARAVREKVAAALGARRLAASAENKDAAESR